MSEKKVKLKYIYPDDLKSNFVTNFIIQHQPDHFVLSFFEAYLPPILGETEAEKKKEIEKIGEVESKCLARLVVTPQKMREIVEVMSDNLAGYEKKLNSEIK